MTLRLVAPAGPVQNGRLATVRARCQARGGAATTRWEWDDGAVEHADLVIGGARTQRSHRYAAPGVYRVEVKLGPGDDEPREMRYVTVRTPNQAAGSGWIREDASAARVPFGFLITPAGEHGRESIVLRCVLGVDEIRAIELTWLFADGRSFHFGGSALIGSSKDVHPFRVDVRTPLDGRRGPRQQLTMSVYAAGDVPGHDSPLHRLSGPVRPGRIELGPYAEMVSAR